MCIRFVDFVSEEKYWLTDGGFRGPSRLVPSAEVLQRVAAKPARHKDFCRRFTTDTVPLHRIDPAAGRRVLTDKHCCTCALTGIC